MFRANNKPPVVMSVTATVAANKDRTLFAVLVPKWNNDSVSAFGNGITMPKHQNHFLTKKAALRNLEQENEHYTARHYLPRGKLAELVEYTPSALWEAINKSGI